MRLLGLGSIAVAGLLLLTACQGSSQPQGLRGMGTVLWPGDGLDGAPDPQQPSPTSVPPTPTAAAPAPVATPTSIERPSPRDGQPSDSVEAESRVVPPSMGSSTASPLPARRVIIPSIGLDAKIIQLGTYVNRRGELVWETAPFAVGHHLGTAGPGQPGNMVLSGHITSPNEGAVFKNLPTLRVGEGVIVATDERQYLYRVVSTKVVTPDAVDVMAPTPEATATLITCIPLGVYDHRLVVTARLV